MDLTPLNSVLKAPESLNCKDRVTSEKTKNSPRTLLGLKHQAKFPWKTENPERI